MTRLIGLAQTSRFHYSEKACDDSKLALAGISDVACMCAWSTSGHSKQHADVAAGMVLGGGGWEVGVTGQGSGEEMCVRSMPSPTRHPVEEL